MHVAEVLRQVEGAGLEKNGWVGGDAWFGSAQLCVELKKLIDVNSHFVAKNKTIVFHHAFAHVTEGRKWR